MAETLQVQYEQQRQQLQRSKAAISSRLSGELGQAAGREWGWALTVEVSYPAEEAEIKSVIGCATGANQLHVITQKKRRA